MTQRTLHAGRGHGAEGAGQDAVSDDEGARKYADHQRKHLR